MSRDEFLGYVRHILGAIGAIIASRGGSSASGYAELVVGIGMIVGAMVWSAMDKRFKARDKEGS